MTDVSVIGLGNMGTALAQAFLGAGLATTVWNRTAERTRGVINKGAVGVPSFEDAVLASPLLIICLDSYSTSNELFSKARVDDRLRDHVVVQLSTGTPKEVRESSAWFLAQRASYLDGAILGGPQMVGTANITMIYSGERTAFDRCYRELSSLSPNTIFVGDDVTAAATLDFAWLTKAICSHIALACGAAMCRADNIPVATYASLFPNEPRAGYLLKLIQENDFRRPGATVEIYRKAMKIVGRYAHEEGINPVLLDMVTSVLSEAAETGHGEENIASLVRVFESA